MKVKLLNHDFYELVNHFEGKIYEAIKDIHSELIKVNVGIENSLHGWLAFEKEWLEIIDEPQTDSIVESVINQFKQRSEAGINKYGTTLDRNDLSTLEWIEHAKQEAMDFILYLEKLKQELK